MKAIFLSLIFFFTANATNWYVNRDTPAGESGNGTSWSTAWKTIGVDGGGYGGINWSVIGNGDTIYVSGGTDSTLYLPRFSGQPHYINPVGTFTFSTQVVIAPAWQVGHNGEVYIGQANNSAMTLFQIGGISGIVNNVKVTGFTFIDLRDYGAPVGGLMQISGDNNVIDNCHIITAALSPIFGLNGYHLIVSNCIIEDPPNEYTAGQDIFGIYQGRGGHTIENNLMIMRNNYTMVDGTANGAVTTTNNSLTDTRLNETTNYHTPGITIHCNGKTMLVTSNSGSTFYGSGGWSGGSNPGNGHAWYMEGAHRDVIQYAAHDNALPGENLQHIVRNNIILDQGTRGTGWNGLIYTSSPKCNVRFLVYNNIFVNKEEISAAGIFMYESESATYSTSIRFFNNTLIMKGDGAINPSDGLYSSTIPIGIQSVDTLIIKNNLIVCDSTVKTFYGLGASVIPYKDINNNIYASDDYNAESFAYNDNGIIKTWAQWKALGWDVTNSDTIKADAVIFQNKYDSLATGYRTLTGMGLGEDLSTEYPFLRYDILGNDRGSSWDIGAVQYVGSPPSGINVKGKIFLQGPFSTNSMLTNLNQSSLLPNSQPYNLPPWNYNGNENLGSGPNSTMVDWVLVELRSASNPAQVVARRAAVLNNNGLLLNISGSEGVDFNNVDPGSYYIAIYHRNHLAIMSATPVSLSSNSALYDFTTAMNKAYGQNPMVELVSGKFGMYATDGNADGIVNTTDRDNVWLIQNGNMGYLEGDFNMNSGVTVHDVNQLWNLNNGAMTQVP